MADTKHRLGITLTLPDGRPLRVWAGGDPGGVPVIYFHGTPSSRLQAVSGGDAAARQGVRLIAANRPGYGAAPDAPSSLSSVAQDTLALADSLRLGRFVVLGVSGGGPYALACGALAPERVAAVGVAVGIGPWRLIDPPGAIQRIAQLWSLPIPVISRPRWRRSAGRPRTATHPCLRSMTTR